MSNKNLTLLEKVMSFLFNLNNKLYNYPAHVAILILWLYWLISTELTGFLSVWILLGLLSYFALWSWRIKKTGVDSVRETLKDGLLAHLVGLNLMIILGPISIPFSLFLGKMEKDNRIAKK